MRLSIQFKPIYFFYEKISHAQKHSQASINEKNKILRAQTSKRVKVVCFTFWCFLCVQNLFVKKK